MLFTFRFFLDFKSNIKVQQRHTQGNQKRSNVCPSYRKFRIRIQILIQLGSISTTNKPQIQLEEEEEENKISSILHSLFMACEEDPTPRSNTPLPNSSKHRC
jgi:hypothetical protein